MADEANKAPDFQLGFPLEDLADGKMVAGHFGEEEVVLARRGDQVFAFGAHCTHYGGPLAEGLIVGDTVRCPWHHACFSMKSGEALAPPALSSISCWQVEQAGGKVYLREKLPELKTRPKSGARASAPASVVIVGGGAAGFAAAEMLRRENYGGAITIISADDAPPCDRPNLSKDFLAGTAQPDWIPLRPPEFYTENRIELLLKTRVASIDTVRKRLQLENGTGHDFGALLLATGSEPIKLKIPGAEDSQVLYLRSFADSQAIIDRAASSRRVVVIGASFIGLEVAASMRTRGISVSVVAPDRAPLERVMGPELGNFIRKLHEDHGAEFHLGNTVQRVDGRKVTLSGGTTLEADFLVAGVGVRPAISLAEQAGLAIDRGVVVNEFLETSAPGIFAAGDIARWPDPHSGSNIRAEHWAVAERQGQTAARNILGYRERFTAVPFFWSQHYDVPINYVGHAEKWDELKIEGNIENRDCTVSYMKEGRRLAVATIYRDRESLEIEAGMESALERK